MSSVCTQVVWEVSSITMEMVLQHSAMDGSLASLAVSYTTAGLQACDLVEDWKVHGVPSGS